MIPQKKSAMKMRLFFGSFNSYLKSVKDANHLRKFCGTEIIGDGVGGRRAHGKKNRERKQKRDENHECPNRINR